MTDEAGARAFDARVGGIVQRELNMPLSRSGATCTCHALKNKGNLAFILRLLGQESYLDESMAESTIIT